MTKTNRPKPPERKPYTVRLSEKGDQSIAEIARREGVSWSEAARRMLHYAARNMPQGYGDVS